MTIKQLDKIINLFLGLYIHEPIHIGSDLLSDELGHIYRWDDKGLRKAGFSFLEDTVNKGLIHVPTVSLFAKGLTPEQLELIYDTFNAGKPIEKP